MARTPNASRQTHQLLVTMLQQPRSWRHGYELAKETGLKSGTLYPLLMRLNDQGLLDSRWKDPDLPGKPPRHMYRLTAGGLALARSIEAEGEEGAARPRRFSVGA